MRVAYRCCELSKQIHPLFDRNAFIVLEERRQAESLHVLGDGGLRTLNLDEAEQADEARMFEVSGELGFRDELLQDALVLDQVLARSLMMTGLWFRVSTPLWVVLRSPFPRSSPS